VNVLLQVGLEPNAELTRMGVPSVLKYVKSEDDRKVVELVISQQVFQRSYIAPPGLPAEQLDTLRSAFDATMADRQFLDDAERIRIDISPLTGTRCRSWCKSFMRRPRTSSRGRGKRSRLSSFNGAQRKTPGTCPGLSLRSARDDQEPPCSKSRRNSRRTFGSGSVPRYWPASYTSLPEGAACGRPSKRPYG
jgi:hypothetical protein